MYICTQHNNFELSKSKNIKDVNIIIIEYSMLYALELQDFSSMRQVKYAQLEGHTGYAEFKCILKCVM